MSLCDAGVMMLSDRSISNTPLHVMQVLACQDVPMGKCEAMSSIHSDVSLLKSLLFESAYEDLKALTEGRYYTYRDNAYATAAAARQPIPDVRCPLLPPHNPSSIALPFP